MSSFAQTAREVRRCLMSTETESMHRAEFVSHVRTVASCDPLTTICAEEGASDENGTNAQHVTLCWCPTKSHNIPALRLSHTRSSHPAPSNPLEEVRRELPSLDASQHVITLLWHFANVSAGLLMDLTSHTRSVRSSLACTTRSPSVPIHLAKVTTLRDMVVEATSVAASQSQTLTDQSRDPLNTRSGCDAQAVTALTASSCPERACIALEVPLRQTRTAPSRPPLYSSSFAPTRAAASLLTAQGCFHSATTGALLLVASQEHTFRDPSSPPETDSHPCPVAAIELTMSSCSARLLLPPPPCTPKVSAWFRGEA
mmetsp:Transcript_15275/g.38350  ORF Transcript_15275/g.38350 Transcript_15275/m.38350 type:complete len:314 (+) Transcript_15275:205-1146(+)